MKDSKSAQEFQQRAKRFALGVIKLFQALPRRNEAQIIGEDILRSGIAVAANCRSVGRVRSSAEFIEKMEQIVKEIDETILRIELLVESGIMPSSRVRNLISEGTELLAVFSAARDSALAKIK